MAFLTREQIAKLAEIIRKHASWVSWRLLGNKFVTKADLKKLENDGLIPKDVKPSVIKQAFVLGKMESVLKESEWKELSWNQIKDVATEIQTPLQKMQIEASEMSMDVTLRGLFEDIQGGLFGELARATGAAVTVASVQEKVAGEIKAGTIASSNYIKVANGLVDSLKEPRRNWHRVAANELHAAREKGVVNSILEGEETYRRADGADSDVAIRPDYDACEDCKRLYLGADGKPKIFKLSELMANEGSNYIRPWRKNARPVVPPLHPHCFCRIRYIPPGWGWNDKGRFTVVDSDKYVQHLDAKVAKSVSILKGGDDHSLLSEALQHIPTREEILAIQDPEEALALATKLRKLKDLHTDDAEQHQQINGLEHTAWAHVVHLGGAEGEDNGE